jgi:hypothetical protein
LVSEDAKRIQGEAGARDRRKINEHLDGVRIVEQQIGQTIRPPETEWNSLSLPTPTRSAAGLPVNKQFHMRLMLNLLVLAFSNRHDTHRDNTKPERLP